MPPTQLIPGEYNERFAAFFGWYTRRLFRKKFHAVRLAMGSREVLARHASTDAPLVIAMNHSSWWDPLIAVVLGRSLCPERSACAPIDAAMLAKFGMFKKLGLFGIDPDDARGMTRVLEYVLARFEGDRKPTLWITPQGRFADVRETIAIRPGVAAIVARAQAGASGPARVLSVAIEYAFWLEQKPEVFLRIVEVDAPQASSTPHWHRAIEDAMQANATKLAALVRSRDPRAFESLLTSTGATAHPVMDLWLRLRGVTPQLDDRTRPHGAAPSHSMPQRSASA